MMKKIEVKLLGGVRPTAEEVPQLFRDNGIVYHDISCVDWEREFPYKPSVRFAMAQTDSAILIHYKVSENCIRAAATSDNGHVWEDSCCEFFVQPVADGTYYNFECNCAGTLLIGYGKDRNGRELAPADILRQVSRKSSLGSGVIEQRSGNFEWDMALVIPFTAFFKHDVKSLKGQIVRGNFYKCGDKTDTPHFLSWNRIDVPNPDFHRSDYFGEFQF